MVGVRSSVAGRKGSSVVEVESSVIWEEGSSVVGGNESSVVGGIGSPMEGRTGISVRGKSSTGGLTLLSNPASLHFLDFVVLLGGLFFLEGSMFSGDPEPEDILMNRIALPPSHSSLREPDPPLLQKSSNSIRCVV